MTIEVRNGFTYISADEGKFLANRNMTIYGLEIVLGSYDSPENYIELPIEEWPEIPEEPDEPINDGGEVDPVVPIDTESGDTQEHDEEHQLALAKAAKLREIDAYDMSTHVNGFYLNGQLMWLDRETRSSLRNTIESSIIVGRENLDIWFGDMHVNISINNAKMMLAVLEVYATDCYNVTAQHKISVRALENISEVEEFDVTNGYPQMPEFGPQS